MKDAEINILRRRIQSMQEQIEQILLPNGNNLVRSQISPPPEDSISHIKVILFSRKFDRNLPSFQMNDIYLFLSNSLLLAQSWPNSRNTTAQ